MADNGKPRRKARTKIRPEYRAGEREQVSRHWRSLFLDTLADTSNVTLAAARAGVSTSRAYKVRRSEPEFARKWTAALIEGYENLELETLHRLRTGTAAGEPKFDIGAALRLLALHHATIRNERAKNDDADEEAALSSLTAKLEAMCAHDADAQAPAPADRNGLDA